MLSMIIYLRRMIKDDLFLYIKKRSLTKSVQRCSYINEKSNTLINYDGTYIKDPLGDYEKVIFKSGKEKAELINEYWPLDCVYVESTFQIPELQNLNL